jgi:hypothetical protein
MTATNHEDAMFIGGPQDGIAFASEGLALVEIDIKSMLHRYVRTKQHRERDGRSFVVYNYDGEVDPTGGQPGVVASTDPTNRMMGRVYGGG